MSYLMCFYFLTSFVISHTIFPLQLPQWVALWRGNVKMARLKRCDQISKSRKVISFEGREAKNFCSKTKIYLFSRYYYIYFILLTHWQQPHLCLNKKNLFISFMGLNSFLINYHYGKKALSALHPAVMHCCLHTFLCWARYDECTFMNFL